MNTYTFDKAAYTLAEIASIAAAAAKMCERVGLPAPTMSQTSDWATLSVPSAAAAGWRVVAHKEAAGEGLVKVWTKDESLLVHARRPCACEHCGTNRRRVESFVLSNGDKTIEVGSTCLNDFTGANFLPTARAAVRGLSELEMSFGMPGPRGGHAATGAEAVAFAAEATRTGFVGRKAVDEAMFRGTSIPTTSADEMSHLVYHATTEARVPSAADLALAQAEVERVLALEFPSAMEITFADGVRFGLDSSDFGAFAYHFSTLRRIELTANMDAPKLATGQVLAGVKATVARVKAYTNAYGGGVIYNFVTEAGQVLTLFASAGAAKYKALAVGAEVVIKKATVKQGTAPDKYVGEAAVIKSPTFA